MSVFIVASKRPSTIGMECVIAMASRGFFFREHGMVLLLPWIFPPRVLAIVATASVSVLSLSLSSTIDGYYSNCHLRG